MPQRLLWASTSTKNPAYRDHGVVRPSLQEDVAGAESMMRELEPAGIEFERATDELLAEGLRLFAQPYASLLAVLERARSAA